MPFRLRPSKIWKDFSQDWFKVWDVRNYYTSLESRAKAGARLSFGYVMMVVVSAAMATGGLLINSPAVVIGSMCVAPFLGPSRAVCIGGIFRNRKIFWGGIIKQLFGLLIIGAGVAYIITALLQMGMLEVQVISEILIRSMPTLEDVVLSVLIAVSAGAAASLALIADPRILDTPWGQIVDAVIGVEIAISLIPPAAVLGLGAALGIQQISYNAFSLLMVNFLGLNIFGSMLMLVLFGVRTKYLILEKNLRNTVESTLKALEGIFLEESTIDVTLLSPKTAKIHVITRNTENNSMPDSLAKIIAHEIKDKTGCKSDVKVEMIPIQTYSML